MRWRSDSDEIGLIEGLCQCFLVKRLVVHWFISALATQKPVTAYPALVPKP
jgi:hypothetical protein